MTFRFALLKPIASLALALIFLLIITDEQPSFAGANTPQILVVCKTGGCQYEKIQPAIDDARSGDFVLVGTGRYQENLVIGKSISLLGVGQDFAMLRCTRKSQPIIFIDGSQNISVKIENLSLIGNGKCSGIEATGDNLNLELAKLRIGDGLLMGISINGAGDVHVVQTQITRNATGVLLASQNGNSGTPWLRVSVANSTISENSENGLRVAGFTQLALSNSVITQNGLWGLNAMMAACGDGRQGFAGRAQFDSKSRIQNNNISGLLNGYGNPGRHPFTRLPDGQVCLP